MSEKIQEIALHLGEEVELSLNTLRTRLSTVEKELDLECLNLRDMVSSRDPEVNRQLDALSSSIKNLHESLAEVKGHLQNAAVDGRELREAAAPSQDLEAESESHESLAPGMTAQEESRLRHDEAITLSGIFRALFMADEPAQRAEAAKKNTF